MGWIDAIIGRGWEEEWEGEWRTQETGAGGLMEVSTDQFENFALHSQKQVPGQVNDDTRTIRVPIQYKSNRTNERTDQRYPITWCHFCQMLTKYVLKCFKRPFPSTSN